MRTKRPLSIDQLARSANITATRLARIERGTEAIYLDDLFGLAQALRIRPSTLTKRFADAVASVLKPLPQKSSGVRSGAGL